MAKIEADSNTGRFLDFAFSHLIPTKVTEVVPEADGRLTLQEVTHPTYGIDFPQNPYQFAGKEHQIDPTRPLLLAYCSFRNRPTEFYQLAALALKDRLEEAVKEGEIERPKFLIGIPEVGGMIAVALSRVTWIPKEDLFEKVGSGASRHLRVAHIFRLSHGEPALFVDDVFSKGETKKEALAINNKAARYKPAIGAVINHGSETDLNGVPIITAMTLKEAVEYGLENNRVAPTRIAGAERYLASLK